MTDQDEQDSTGTAAQGEGPVVVGIGASAGGLAALHALFSTLPEKSGLAYVVVVHLSPEHKSRLAEILQAQLPIPVQQVNDTTRLQPDCVYVIPPNRNLSAIDTHLRLSKLEEQRAQRAPIDHFLRTLSQTHDGNSAAVILSGTGSDGALGIKAIKEKGGLTVVQDPNESEYDGMPQNAIATGLVDLVLPVDQILGAVLRYARTRPRLARAADGELVLEERQLLHKIFGQLRTHTGRDFTSYKRSTLLRRIQRRMQMRHVEQLSRYLDLLREDPREVHALGDDFLITVTNFFRDREVFEALEREIVPGLFEGKGPDDCIRVWSVGCATGEEAYSLAMLLLEEAGRRDAPPRLQIFASDLHERSLARAREGFYPGDIEMDVSEERIRRFFHREDGGYRIRKEVRELIVFAPHNLLGDPPFSRLDLIACRNVLIYLQRGAQKDVLDLFHYALNPDGYLVLGDAETVEGLDLFRAAPQGRCVYLKRNVQAPEPRLPVFPATSRMTYLGGGDRPAVVEPAPVGVLHQRMVERYAPPSVLVSPDDKVVHLSEHAGRYLVAPGGEATLNLFRLAREELRVELRAGLHAVRSAGEPVRSAPIAVRIEGGERLVTLDVRPSLELDHQGYALVIFDEQGRPREGEEAADESPPARGRGESEADAELTLTRQRLQAIIEQYEAGQEELRASNEELQSANEELRSTLEELETSREELQSMNEELQTVNQENRHKMEEFAQISADLQNLLASTEIATLFLDRELGILRFTPRVAELFNVRPADRGRPISDLTHRLEYPELQEDARRVLDRLIPVEREVADQSGRWYLTRILPYRSSEDRIGGVVITLVEITERRRAEEALRVSEGRYRALIEASAQTVWTTDAEGQVVEDSPSWRAYTGQSVEEWVGTGWLDAVHPEDREEAHATWRRCVAEAHPVDTEFRLRHAPSDSWRWTQMRAIPLRDDAGALYGWVGMNVDVEERREAEDTLRHAKDAAERADRVKTEFLAVMSHELRTPLTGIIGYTDLMSSGVFGPLTPRQHESIDRVQSCSWHLVSIIDEILTLSRMEAGREQVHREPTDLAWVLHEVLNIMTPAAEAKGLVLTGNGSDPVIVDTDPGKVRQVLLNLVGNAVRYTEQGEVEVGLDLSEPEWFQLHVHDTGPGIDLANQERIFEPFTQLDSAYTRRQSGTGLGLAISRRLARLMDGEIEVRSAPGQGSTFTFRIPR